MSSKKAPLKNHRMVPCKIGESTTSIFVCRCFWGKKMNSQPDTTNFGVTGDSLTPVRNFIRTNWRNGHACLSEHASFETLVKAWPFHVEESLDTLTALARSHYLEQPMLDILSAPDLRKIIRSNLGNNHTWFAKHASFDAVVAAWPFQLEESLQVFRAFVSAKGHNPARAWRHVPEGKFADAYLQAIPAHTLVGLDMVMSYQLRALATVESRPMEEHLMHVLLGRPRDNVYILQVIYFVNIAFKQPLTREWVLQMNQDFGTSRAGVDFLIATGFLFEGDDLRVFI